MYVTTVPKGVVNEQTVNSGANFILNCVCFSLMWLNALYKQISWSSSNVQVQIAR